jgi:predicted GIY-YIG superfamily endonuclease
MASHAERVARSMPSEALAKEGPRMHYVYLLRSVADPKQTYIGLTDDLRARMERHNAGASAHTSKFKPWEIMSYTAFRDRSKAAAYERYLKTGSGHAFAKRRLW